MEEKTDIRVLPLESGFRCAAMELDGETYCMRELSAGEVEALSELRTDEAKGIATTALALSNRQGMRAYPTMKAALEAGRLWPSTRVERLSPLLRYVQRQEEDGEGN